MMLLQLLKDVLYGFGMYLIYVLIGGVCFMAIERFCYHCLYRDKTCSNIRPLETQTCREVEMLLTNAHKAMKDLEAITQHRVELDQTNSRRRRSPTYVHANDTVDLLKTNIRNQVDKKDEQFQLNFHETYKIQINFPVARHHVAGLTLQYYSLVSTNKSARVKVEVQNDNCSVMVVSFERVHDTKEGSYYLRERGVLSKVPFPVNQ